TLILVTGLRPIHLIRETVGATRRLGATLREWQLRRRLRKADLKGKLEIRERQLAKERRMYEKALRKKGMPVSEPVGATISPEELTNRPEPKVVDTTALPSEPLTRLARKPSLAELRASEEKAKADSNVTSVTSSWENYVLPGLDLLDEHSLEGRAATDPSELEEVRQILIDTLAQFGIAVAPGDITKGPTITRYEVYPAKGVRVDKIVSINALIASMLFRFSPKELRFVLIDPKMVELQAYNSLPHLAFPIVTDPKKVLLALRWLIDQMEYRYKIFARLGVRNIVGFNARPTKKKEAVAGIDDPGREDETAPRGPASPMPATQEQIPDKLPYVVVIIDELADLMQTAPADVETAIARITQMARAAGIHVIVATQTPRADVITGVIKANIPSRIAFQVASKIDSRVILDENGAERLLGQGDMLYLPPSASRLIRAQGVLVTDNEIHALVEFISKQSPPAFDSAMHEKLQSTSAPEEE